MEKKKNTRDKVRKVLSRFAWCVGVTVILFLTVLFLLKRTYPMQRKRPLPLALSNKEHNYFKTLEGIRGWGEVNREVRQVLPDEAIDGVSPTSKAYLLGVELKDSVAFCSLNEKLEDKIARHILDSIVGRHDSIQRINIFFSYEHQLGDNASEGWYRTAEYNVKGKKLVKMKQ